MTPSSLLLTDGYKFSMAEAGFPLRHEVFYQSHRRGGWQYVPLDIEAHVRSLLPKVSAKDFAYLDACGYALGEGARDAYTRAFNVKVQAVPRGTWVRDREPIFKVSGPSALVSWLEPLALQINRRIQIATCALLTPERLPEMVGLATCMDERDITRETLDAIGVVAPPISIQSDAYYHSVLTRARRMVQIVGDPDRLFEVGLRAASCPKQHEVALVALRDAGIRLTSNVDVAHRLDITPVGTMGHEHIMRFGSSYPAFCAMRDRMPGNLFLLPDTFSTLEEGVPAAFQVVKEAPNRKLGIRFDSEHDILLQYIEVVRRARALGLDPVYALESGWDEQKTIDFEALRKVLDIPTSHQKYGLGNFFIKPEWPHFGRDTVQAVYKLCQSGGVGRQKMGDEPGMGKESLPGDLVLWRPHLREPGYTGPSGFISQEGEDWIPPVPATRLTGACEIPEIVRFSVDECRVLPCEPLALSPETLRIREACYADRTRAMTSFT